MKIFQGQNLNIAGHKVPLAVLGVIATIGAALLLLRGSANANAASAVQQQASGSGIFGGASGADYSGSLQNLQTQLQAFMAGLGGLQQPGASTPAPGAVPQPNPWHVGFVTGRAVNPSPPNPAALPRPNPVSLGMDSGRAVNPLPGGM